MNAVVESVSLLPSKLHALLPINADAVVHESSPVPLFTRREFVPNCDCDAGNVSEYEVIPVGGIRLMPDVGADG
jgi:hypothetical protein